MATFVPTPHCLVTDIDDFGVQPEFRFIELGQVAERLHRASRIAGVAQPPRSTDDCGNLAARAVQVHHEPIANVGLVFGYE